MFWFCFLARVRLVRKVFWEGMVGWKRGGKGGVRREKRERRGEAA